MVCILSFSSTKDPRVKKDFGKIEDQLRATGISQFVYFSYSAAAYDLSCRKLGGPYCPVPDLYACDGWVPGCTKQGDLDLVSLSATPVYGTEDTKLSIDRQAAALDWLLLQIVKQKPYAQIDLVGFSLGGIVASYWLSGDWKPGADSAFKLHKGKVHSLVLIDSPVGGSPGSNKVLHDCKSDAACHFLRVLLLFFLGPAVPHQLHLPEDDRTRSESIVDSLPKVVGEVPVTSIQSSNDYLVNGQEISLCVDIDKRKCGLKYKAPVGRGSQA